MLTVDQVNSKCAGATIFGWFVGLAWVAYSGSVIGLSWLDWVLLVVVGMFVASIIIGAGFAVLAAGITKLATGRSDGSPHLFAWGVFICPIIAFFSAGPAARLLA